MMELVDVILWAIGIVGTILGILQGIPWLLGMGPKADGSLVYEYLDFEKKTIVEEREYTFTWGIVFFKRKLFLRNIHENATYSLLYKPAAGPRVVLPSDCYVVNKSKNKLSINLVRNKIFKEREVEKIYVQSKTPADEKEYFDKVEVISMADAIKIINHSEIEIRNFLVELPPKITLDKIYKYLSLISGLVTEETDGHKTPIIKLRIKKLEAKHGDDPSVMILPIHK